MKTKTKWLILAGIAVAIVVIATIALNRNGPPQHFTAKVERGEIRDVVEATGMINAVITVQVGSQVSGVIAKLYVDFNSQVHKGQVVALIDPALLQGALLQATADYENAKANMVAANTIVPAKKPALAERQAANRRTGAATTAATRPMQ